MTALPELRSALMDVAERRCEPSGAVIASTAVRARAGMGRRVWRRRLLPVVFVVVLSGAAGALASGLISFGAPAPASPVFSNPRAGLGTLTPGTIRLLPIAAADPHGGPPWGMRVLATNRGAGCVQVGRLVDGKLVALGQDGAFHDDGRAHELPVSTQVDPFSCGLLDGKGQLFDSVTLGSQAASAAWWFGSTGCVPPATQVWGKLRGSPICPRRDERDLYYGLLGPDARSITYTLAGRAHTQATVGAEGAYMIVTTSTATLHFGPTAIEGGIFDGTSDDVPVFSPITAIHYRDGSTCHLLTASTWIVGSHACSPLMREPVGYVAVAPAPTRAEVATPVHARLSRGRDGRRVIVVSFTSRVAIDSVRSQYLLRWHDPSMPARVHGYTQFGGNLKIYANAAVAGAGVDIAAGHTATVTIGGAGPRLPAGVTRGSVTLVYSGGSEVDGDLTTAHVLVGRFAITLR